MVCCVKRVLFLVVALFLLVYVVPLGSRAAVTPYFIAVNDTLLPFSDDTMPYVSGGEFFVPYKIFTEAEVWSLVSAEAGRVHLYKGGKHLDFFTVQGITMDQDGNVLECSPAIRSGNGFYLPLGQVCDFFGLDYEVIDIGREIIPDEQMSILRIKSNAVLVFNANTFVGVNRYALKASYDAYYHPPLSPPPTTAPPPTEPATSQPPGDLLPLPSVPPIPTYEDVTIYLCFRSIGSEGTLRIIDILNATSASGHPSCFFVSATEIAEQPELVRMISGNGHTVGIWLDEGTFEEYLEASSLLFEATKIKTVLVSSDETEVTAIYMADLQGLVFWGASMSFGFDGDFMEDSLISAMPTESGEICNISFACTEEAASALPDVLAHLREFKYTVSQITETTLGRG
jgi:hypothetical protein